MAPDDKIRNTVRNHIHNVVCDNEKKIEIGTIACFIFFVYLFKIVISIFI